LAIEGLMSGLSIEGLRILAGPIINRPIGNQIGNRHSHNRQSAIGNPRNRQSAIGSRQ
jgi:hypothetical protein